MPATRITALLAVFRAVIPFTVGPTLHRILTIAGLAIVFVLQAFGVPGVPELLHLSTAHLQEVVLALTSAATVIRVIETTGPQDTPLRPPSSALIIEPPAITIATETGGIDPPKTAGKTP